MKTIRILLTACAILLATYGRVNAQLVLDGVVAEVGNEVILQSEVDAQMLQYRDLSEDKRIKAKCLIMDQMLIKKLLLNRAKIDSLKLGDDRVENEIDRRLQFFVQQYGSEEAIEKFYHKSINEIKNDFREAVREQMLEQQMQQKATGDAEPTPEEIKKFYETIPADSLPRFNTEMEIGQIFVVPKPGREARQMKIEDLRQKRKDVLSGKKSFCSFAIGYSEDFSTALKCGDLGWHRADEYEPNFASTAILLKKDSISDVVETKYGFHIIQMIERKGDKIHCRHILMRAAADENTKDQTGRFLDSLRAEILRGNRDSLFSSFAYKFSQDDETKNRGGMMIDQKTNSSHIPNDAMDKATFGVVDDLSVGEISSPSQYRNAEGKEGYRIVYLKSKNAPHKANLKDDYTKIKELAGEDKRGKALDKWVRKYIPITYVHVSDEYKDCQILKKWHSSVVTQTEN